MINITTSNQAIDWLISKASYTDDLNQEDIDAGCSKFIIGQFKGNLNYRMAQQVKRWAKENSSIVFSKTEDGTREDITIRIKFGTTRHADKVVNFVIDHCIETV